MSFLFIRLSVPLAHIFFSFDAFSGDLARFILEERKILLETSPVKFLLIFGRTQ